MNKPTFKFEKTPVWRAFLQVIKTGIFVCAAVDIVVMFVAVVMRYIFHEDFFGYEEILMNVILWMYYLGAAYATYNETHIKGDVMSFVFKTGLLGCLGFPVCILEYPLRRDIICIAHTTLDWSDIDLCRYPRALLLCDTEPGEVHRNETRRFRGR